MTKSTCPAEDCGAPSRSRFIPWCDRHYRMIGRYGKPELPYRRSIEERFWAKVAFTESCWLWLGPPTISGYGQFEETHGDPIGPHVYSYRLAYGAVPQGLTVDHLCHNADPSCLGGPACPHRRCVRPDHLDAVPIGENLRRSPNTLASINLLKTHCPQGHPYSGENLYVNPKGSRICRLCAKAAGQEYEKHRPPRKKPPRPPAE